MTQYVIHVNDKESIVGSGSLKGAVSTALDLFPDIVRESLADGKKLTITVWKV